MNKRTGPLKVALLGCGVVGSQVARQILELSDDLYARIGRPLELVGIGVRNLAAPRPGIEPSLLTDDPMALVSRTDLDLVVEVIGGIEPARSLILRAIASGASIVTANPALLASDGGTIFAAAEDAGVDVYYEAAVAGAIPIIRPLRESLVGDAVTDVMGIVNGTTNFVLDKMTTQGDTFAEALAEAQRLGFAEADPTADVEGFDAAAKAAILAGLAFHSRVTLDDVTREGITGITVEDVADAKAMNATIKLVARATLSDDDSIAVGVHPTMVANAHPLASVSGAYNAIFIRSRNAGELMFVGPGAGGTPTASAIMGDVVTAARNRVRGVSGPGQSTYRDRAITAPSDIRSGYFVSLMVKDEPGVLASVATAFAEHGVSLQAVRQDGAQGDGEPMARLGVLTHQAADGAVQETLLVLGAQPYTMGAVRLMRFEG